MRILLFAGLLLAAITSRPATPQAAPNVVTDIAPVHALASIVMDGVGEPALLISPGSSPHDYQMRPSDARKLASADIVIWTGSALTPWLEGPVGSLAENAVMLELLRVEGTLLLQGDEHGLDPHAWLDPENGKKWLTAIAKTLGASDPANAKRYAGNARSGVNTINFLIVKLKAQLKPFRGKPFVVAHDAYQYFEKRFRLRAVTAIAEGDAAPPGPRRLSTVRQRLLDSGAGCIFAEPQFPPRLLATVVENTGAKIVQLDPVGGELALGSEFYEALLGGMGSAFVDCLDQ
ncbi:MAG: zinc ABC transporter substrate-binding protein [Alphaproteobacteria bacterium]